MEYSMPSFRDENGRVMVWDPTSMSYVVDPGGDALPDPDRSHATGGDNDLFDPFQHTEQTGVPELEGIYSKTAMWPMGEEPQQGNGFDMSRPGLLQRRPWEDNCPMCRGTMQTVPGTWTDQYGTHYHTKCRRCGFEVGRNGPMTDAAPGDMTLSDMGIPPEAENYYRTAAEWAPEGHVLCPNCQSVTADPQCPTCGKDLTPEWNAENEKNNEFMDVMPQHSDASEFTSWPIREPKRNRMHTDDSFPSETTARVWAAATRLASFKQITADEWDDMFSGTAPLKTEIGKWLIDKGGNLHIDHGMHALHENIAARDGINYPGDVGALGSVYNDGTADVQRVFPGFQFDQQTAQAQIEQAFGPVTLAAPVGQAGAQSKGVSFQPFEIQGGQWVIAPMYAQQPLTGVAWVKERSNNVPYQPNMIMVAEHLQPEDFTLYSRGATAIITATGGLTSHAAYLASTEGIPVVVGIGESYNKIETGNYLKVDPATQTITVMPGASGAMAPDQKQQVWDSYLQYQRQRGGSLKPEYFAHIDEELAWRQANTPTLDSCPDCSQPMTDQDGESVCHGCGHKQPIIQHQAGALALVPELAAGAEGAAGAAGAGGAAGGIGGIGGIMQKALGGNPLQTAYYGDRLLGGGNDKGGGGGDAGTAGLSQNFDSGAETQGVLSRVTEAGVLSILEGMINVLQKTPEAFADPKNPLSYVDDVAAAGLGGAGGAASGLTGGAPGAPGAGGVPAGVISKNLFWDHLGAGAFGEEEVGRGTKNDGTNSTDDASKSGIEGEKEHGDSPEQLKDVDGMGGTDESMTKEKLQGDPALQDKALKAFHMNLPLVIEFANSDEPGSENPILMALDQLLEEAFPGYKDGHDEAAAEDEHPVTEIHEEIHPEEKDESEDESGEKPEEGDSKEDSKKESSYQSDDDWFHLSYGGPTMPGTGDPVAGGGYGAPAAAPGAPAPGQPASGGTCPMCGQSHLPGTPCPTPANVTAPAATGAPVTPPQPNTVVTKWQVVAIGAPTPGLDDIGVLAPDAGNEVGVRGPVYPETQACPECGLSLRPHSMRCEHCGALADGAGYPAGAEDAQQYGTNPLTAAAVDPEFAFFAAAEEGEHHHQHEVEHKPEHHEPHVDGSDTSEASTPWLDEAGAPLEEGADYELKSSDYAIPDRVTINRILPEKLVFTIHSGDVDYQDEISHEELQTQGYSFAPASPDHTGVDSMDGFTPSEDPVRPGQDATPQVDDLSSPSTVVSSEQEFEYVPKFASDRLADRQWLLGESSEVAVDPGLMAKLAGKSFSPREQREFIDEKGTARNLDRLDLDGTHYVMDGINTDDVLW